MAAVLQIAIQILFFFIKLLPFDQNFMEISSQGSINNKVTLVQIMAWHQTGDKPLSESMMA